MKIFISWSGDKSRRVATYLKTWIEQIIQAADPWISVDIDKGKKWNKEIVTELEETKVGIICITRENLRAPWVLFEAGALSKTEDSYVCTFLIDLSPTDLTGPLSIFQATRFNKEDVFKLLSSINANVGKSGGKKLSPENLKEMFTVFYPKLEEQIGRILDESPASNEEKPEIRTDRDLLEEAVGLLRNIYEPPPQDNLEFEVKQMLNFYATKYAKLKGLENYYDVGADPKTLDGFMSVIGDNPLLLKVYKGKEGLRDSVARFYDGLPF